MEIKIPEVKTTEHDVVADNNLDILQGLVTGTLVNQDKTPSTIGLFEFMDQHKAAILTEQAADNARFEQIIVFSMTAHVLSSEKVIQLLQAVEGYGLSLASRYLLISTTMDDSKVFNFLAEKKVSILDQPSSLVIHKTDAQLIYMIECMLGSAEYQKTHASDINTFVRLAAYTEQSAPVGLKLLKATSDKVKSKDITHALLRDAVKADPELAAKYFDAPEPAVVATPPVVAADIAIVVPAAPVSSTAVIEDKLAGIEAQVARLTELLAAKLASK